MELQNKDSLSKNDMIELAISIATHIPKRTSVAACLAECLQEVAPDLPIEQRQKMCCLTLGLQEVILRYFPDTDTATDEGEQKDG